MNINKNKYRSGVHLLSDAPIEDQLLLKDKALLVSAEGITISDNTQRDNPIIYANKGFERLTGYPVDRVLGRNCRFLQGPDSNAETVSAISEAVRNEREITVEILNYRKDGTTFWNRLSITPLRNDKGRVTHFIGIQSDVTNPRRAEDELRKTTQQLEAANQRMKGDLEAARQLQLDMLPEQTPSLDYLDIAVAMKTAQEVGGDYYDFHVNKNNHLTAAIGDATGHGLKAGTVVTATKSLYNSLAHHPDPVSILKNMSLALKNIGFRNMYMAMLIAKFTPDTLLVSSAGMPYTYHYRRAEDRVDEIILKGMPLGSFPDFDYDSKEIPVQPGDTFLFLSDGLLELPNEKGEQYGEERTRELFAKIAFDTPDRIVAQLGDSATAWSGSTPLRDDMTFLVIKMNSENTD
ncbi:SpoIIE family protein phosphatase [candidate division KSB1 bacterium]|nr:SpoIIE family protein phosphatase [candidate division KSB1 bacterium]